jgi:inward rectifier potassium channel
MLRRRRALDSMPRLVGAMRGDRALRIRQIGERRWHPSDIYHELLRLTWPQLAASFVAFFLSFNLLFAWLYTLDPTGVHWDENVRVSSPFWHALFFSVHTVATIGYGDQFPVSEYANILVVVEITLGILMFALVTGIVFARFSRPTARFRFSNIAVVHELGGKPTLMFRAANLRHNLVFEARANVSILADEVLDGTRMRRFRDLKLVRDANPVFALTWTIMHVIDEESPLASVTQSDLNSEIIVVLSGIDDRTGQGIHGRWSYLPSDIQWNAKFTDIIDQLPDGTRTIDYRRFDEFVPEESSN